MGDDTDLEALESGRLAALCLDVLDTEIQPADHPVRTATGAVVTPHIAYLSAESVTDAKRCSIGDLIAVLSGGEPANPVAPVGAAA